MQIYVSGSIAYDRIMVFPGHFSDHLMPEKLHMINVSFTVTGVIERAGGTAGNIAYALSLMGESPTIMATIGRDYDRYFQWLEQHNISRDSIRIIDDEATASAYITTDMADNQITAFNPGAMKLASLFDLESTDAVASIGIVAPGNLDDMIAYTKAYQSKGTNYIFDPGQSIPIWDGNQMVECIQGSQVLISNDYELEMVTTKTGLSKDELLALTGAIITTKGGEGSVITTEAEDLPVAAIPRPDTLVDPTGAGDAYRGGLIKGLVEGVSLVEAAQMGTVCASFAVEVQGTQEYSFTPEEFDTRYREAFVD